MNYELTSELMTGKDAYILVKNKGNNVHIESVMNIETTKKQQKIIDDLIQQANEETTIGFFSLKDSTIVFSMVVNGEIKKNSLMKYINCALASMISFRSMLELEVIINE